MGSGKSAMAASVAMESEFPFVKVISPESLVGFNEQVGGCQWVWWRLSWAVRQVVGAMLDEGTCCM